jgi:hypothetical protein
MKKLHNIVLILCWITLFTNGSLMTRKDKISFCVIKNLHYKNEHLIASNFSDKYIDEDKFVYQNRKKAIIDKLPSNDDNLNQFKTIKNAVWMFEKTSNQTFYIKSFENNNHYLYLCATDNFVDRLEQRRKVNLNNLDRKNQLESMKCQWKLAIGNGSYLIRNLQYKEPLYAASMFYSSGRPMKRNIFTWKNKNANSDQFYWNIYCQN